MKYLVSIEITLEHAFEVEADSEDQAIAQAQADFHDGDDGNITEIDTGSAWHAEQDA